MTTAELMWTLLTAGFSVLLVRDMVTGYFPALPKLHFGIVDVRDVVTAHIRAAESENAYGRYICVAQVVSMLEMGDMVRRAYPSLPIPKRGPYYPVDGHIIYNIG